MLVSKCATIDYTWTSFGFAKNFAAVSSHTHHGKIPASLRPVFHNFSRVCQAWKIQILSSRTSELSRVCTNCDSWKIKFAFFTVSGQQTGKVGWCLKGTFSTNRLYHTMVVSNRYMPFKGMVHNKQSTLFNLVFVEIIPAY